MDVSWLDAFTEAAHREVKLPKGWIGYLFKKVDGQGVSVTGKVVTRAISRGPRKGQPDFRSADPATERTVFVSNAASERAYKRLQQRAQR